MTSWYSHDNPCRSFDMTLSGVEPNRPSVCCSLLHGAETGSWVYLALHVPSVVLHVFAVATGPSPTACSLPLHVSHCIMHTQDTVTQPAVGRIRGLSRSGAGKRTALLHSLLLLVRRASQQQSSRLAATVSGGQAHCCEHDQQEVWNDCWVPIPTVRKGAR